MKIIMVIAALVILVCATIYMMQSTENGRTDNPLADTMQSSHIAVEATGNSEKEQEAEVQINYSLQENRRDEMKATYSQLEQSRQQLKSQANLLKSKFWDLELPAEQASTVTYKMRQAYAYLKNPARLGAYFEVEEILNELKKVKAMQQDLTEIEQLLPLAQNRED